MMKAYKKYLAEFIGTLILVLFACGTAGLTCSGTSEGCGYLVTALSFGLVIVAMAYSIGNISGCHINPAVTIAMLTCKKITLKDFFGYIIAQFAGAIAGAGLLYAIIRDPSKLGANHLYTPANASTADPWLSFFIEVILTFVFVLAILGVTSRSENSNTAGLVIGGTLTLVHLLGISLTGTSVNPARSFGPALISGNLTDIWVFLLAPMVGGILAALLYSYISRAQSE